MCMWYRSAEHLDVLRIDCLEDAHRRVAAVEAVPLVIDADVHRLQDQRHVVLLGDRHGPLQAGDDVVVHLLAASCRAMSSPPTTHISLHLSFLPTSQLASISSTKWS